MLRGARILGVAGSVALMAACTEKLTTAGDCPALCPGGTVEFRDTLLTAVSGGDTTYSGYSILRSAPSVLVSNGGAFGQNRGVIRFFVRGDSVLADSLRPFTSIDSIFIEVVPQAWDPSVTGKVLEIYRLPSTIDTSSSFAAIDAAMTPSSYLGSIPITGASSPSPQYLLFTGADLAKFTFAQGEETSLQIGLKLLSDSPTGMRVGTSASGSAAPSWTTWVSITVADTLQKNFVQRGGRFEFTATPNTAPNLSSLRVGGIPASRSFVRFSLPPFLRDSSIIVRATLLLGLEDSVRGIPGDSIDFVVTNLLSDLGPKSPVLTALLGTSQIKSQQAGVLPIEIVGLVRLWQGAAPLPSVLRLETSNEGASFTVPTFFSTRSFTGGPRLRITYRPRFTFGGF